jgi:hypothetical protein
MGRSADSDPLEDIRRFMATYRQPPPPPEIRAGSRDVATRLFGDPSAPTAPWGSGAVLAGIPIVLDRTMPANMIRIGTSVLIGDDDGSWSVLDLAGIAADAERRYARRGVRQIMARVSLL